MSLYLDTGYSSSKRTRDGIAESCLVVVPNTSAQVIHGALLAVAEGLAERPEPDGASRDALRALGESFYSTPENWALEQSLRESFSTANQAVMTLGERRRAASLTALVLRHRRWTFAHAGDTRLWLLRDHQLRLLTKDHVTPRIGRRPVPHRACGLDNHIDPDIDSGELADGDVFLLTTGGVHLTLDGALIMSSLISDAPTQSMADNLINRVASVDSRALAAVGVARVEKLPPETAADMAENISRLPVIAPPEPGAEIDRFTIEALLHKSRHYRLYRAQDQESGSTVVLKFPNPRHARDPGFADGFLREEWIGKRIDSPYLVKTLPMRAGRRRALYSMMAYQPGENLSERIKRKGRLTVREAVRYAGQLLEALEQMHRQGIVHGDVRAKNINIDKQKRQLFLLGLGTTQIDPLGSMTQSPETPKNSVTHYAPELFAGAPKSPKTDIYAAGVTLYRMLTGRYPYGRVSSRDEAPRGPMIPPSRYNDEVPHWLEQALARACALDPGERFGSAGEFAEALAELGGADLHRHKSAPTTAPSSPALRWEWLLLAGVLATLVLYLFLALR
jgi:protein phosphatase